MSAKDKNSRNLPPKTGPAPAAESRSVVAGEWKGPSPVWRAFPGPKGVAAPLRLALDREPYAEVAAHAKESLDSEVCGVLAGEVCEDEEGFWVRVRVAVRGTASRQGSTHVTFTQETWTAIHQVLERDHRGLQIVGWYHSHPGFGVVFSEMDRFIQQNFFPAPTQVALVTDPLGGAVAVCCNTSDGLRELDRFWVGDREHHCRSARSVPEDASAPAPVELGGLQQELEAVQTRLAQVLRALDDQQARFHRVLMTLFFLVALALVGGIGYFVYSTYRSRLEPPRLNSYVPIPVQVGDRTVLLGVGVAEWQVPPELNAIWVQLEREKQAAADLERKKKGDAGGATNAPALSPNATNLPPLSPPPKP